MMSLVLFIVFVTAIHWSITRGFIPRNNAAGEGNAHLECPSANLDCPTSPSPRAAAVPQCATTSLPTGKAAGEAPPTGYAAGEAGASSEAQHFINYSGRFARRSSPAGYLLSAATTVIVATSVLASAVPSSLVPQVSVSASDSASTASAVSTSTGVSGSGPTSDFDALASGATVSPRVPPLSSSLAALGRTSRPRRFKIVEELGSGLFGSVYLAVVNRREVALKFSTRDEEADAAFAREIRVSESVENDGLLVSEGWWHTVENTVLIMPAMLVDLRGWMESNGPQLWTVALRAFRRVLVAVQALHQAGLIHMDLKPENIMIGLDDTLESMVVGDFGAASMQEEVEAGFPGGTVGYSAPELVDPSLGAPGPKLDVWSLGAVLAFILTAADLIQYSEDQMEMTARVVWGCQASWFDPEDWVSVPEHVVDLVLLLTTKETDARPSITDAISLIDQALATPATVTTGVGTTGMDMDTVTDTDMDTDKVTPGVRRCTAQAVAYPECQMDNFETPLALLDHEKDEHPPTAASETSAPIIPAEKAEKNDDDPPAPPPDETEKEEPSGRQPAMAHPILGIAVVSPEGEERDAELAYVVQNAPADAFVLGEESDDEDSDDDELLPTVVATAADVAKPEVEKEEPVCEFTQQCEEVEESVAVTPLEPPLSLEAAEPAEETAEDTAEGTAAEESAVEEPAAQEPAAEGHAEDATPKESEAIAEPAPPSATVPAAAAAAPTPVVSRLEADVIKPVVEVPDIVVSDFDANRYYFPDIIVPEVNFGVFGTPELTSPSLSLGWVEIGSKEHPVPWTPARLPGRGKRAIIRAQLTLGRAQRAITKVAARVFRVGKPAA